MHDDNLKGKSTTEDIDITTSNLKNMFKNSSDIIFRRIMINANSKLQVSLMFVDGIVDNADISEYVIKPLVDGDKFAKVRTIKQVLNLIEKGAIYYSQQKMTKNINEIVNSLMMGSAVLIFDSEKVALILNTINFDRRQVNEPTEEGSLKGSKDAFVETLRVNTGIIRRRIRNANLVIEEKIVGKQTNTCVAIVYINGITNETIVKEVRKRIDNIDIDQVIGTNNIESYIVDNKYTPFPLVHYTEKPNVFCSSIIEGRVGIIIDGIPFTMIVPANFFSFFNVSDDHSYSYMLISFFRIVSYFSFFISLLLPGFFISITTFNVEMIPSSLAVSIASSQSKVPFPIFIETITMLVLFYILLQSAARLLKSIGNTVAVVGGLVLGEAIIAADLVSPSVIIVVSLTVICSLTLSNADLMASVWVSQFLIIALSSIAGLFGLTMGALIILFHLSKIENLGVPYLSPVVANDYKQMEDILIRLPQSLIKRRPVYLKTTNKQNQK